MRTVLVSMAAALALAAGPASAAMIVLNNLGGVGAGTAAYKGFSMAADFWGQRFTNDVTIKLDVGFRALEPGVLGQTSSNSAVAPIEVVRQASVGRASPFARAALSQAMAKTTPATLALDKAQIAYELHAYDYDPDAPRVGLQAAESLGVSPGQVLKTLMTLVDGRPVCVVLASDREVAMKKLAAAAGGKSAQMMKPADAERTTGYRVGGVSPFGQKRRVPVVIDQDALGHDKVFVNGGQRGLQVRLAPSDLLVVLAAQVAILT